MSNIFDVTQSAYQKWEVDRTPSLEKIVQIARYYKVSIDDLLTKDLSKPENRPGSDNEQGLTIEQMKQLEELRALLLKQQQQITNLAAAVKELQVKSDEKE